MSIRTRFQASLKWAAMSSQSPWTFSRGRYRESLERPSAIPAGKAQRYRFVLPTTNHVFLPGHRIMVQIQSSWFPLYDRNPQTYVENIFFAKPPDYVKATQSVFRSGDSASAIWLPVITSQ